MISSRFREWVDPFSEPGTYHLLHYSGTLKGTEISAFSVLDPQPGFSYAFSNNVALGDVNLTITAVPEPCSFLLLLLAAVPLLTTYARRIPKARSLIIPHSERNVDLSFPTRVSLNTRELGVVKAADHLGVVRWPRLIGRLSCN